MIGRLWRALTATPPAPRHVPYLPTHSTLCVAHGPLPDPACTPGGTVPASLRDLCAPGYAKKARQVSAAKKRAVFAAYALAPTTQDAVDHLIPLELGGSNDLANLWPEPASHAKDLVENGLHVLVCSGQMALAEAQERIATDWTTALPRRKGPA